MKLKIPNIEALVWISGLLYLFFMNIQIHFSFCIFNYLGISFCPGCGLGKSIHFLMHFEFIKSWETHPFGLAAFIILLHRIIIIFKSNPYSYLNIARLK